MRAASADQLGVERVFVEHPVFGSDQDVAPDEVYGGGYVEGKEDEEDTMDLRYSVLCQGALAAPVLLWDLPQVSTAARFAAPDQRRLSNRSPGIPSSSSRQRGLTDSPGADVWGFLGDVDAQEGDGERRRMLDQLEMLSMAVLGSEPAAQQQRSPLSSPVSGAFPRGSAAARSLSLSRSGSAPAPVVFIGNDWSTTPLVLRLKHCIRSGYLLQKYAVPLTAETCPDTTLTSDGERRVSGTWLPMLAHPNDPKAPGFRATAALLAELEPADSTSGLAHARKLPAGWLPEHWRRLGSFAERATLTLSDAHVAFCIHNLAFHGVYPARLFHRLALPPLSFAAMVPDRSLSTALATVAMRGLQALFPQAGIRACFGAFRSGCATRPPPLPCRARTAMAAAAPSPSPWDSWPSCGRSPAVPSTSRTPMEWPW